MKSDADIAAERETILCILGPVVADWYKEACLLEYGHNAEVLLWACRCREIIRTTSRDLGTLAIAAEQLVAVCQTVDDDSGSVKDACQKVKEALWWKD